MDRTIKKYFIILGALVGVWLTIGLLASSSLPSPEVSFIPVQVVHFKEESTLSFPIPESNTYCSKWAPVAEFSLWADRPSAYSVKKVNQSGWKLLPPKSKSTGLFFKDFFNLNYSETFWAEVEQGHSQETNEGLFLIPEETNFVFTRMYHYRDSQFRNIQTARLGVDYACPGQIFNHVPGASAFSRKDFLQKYLIDYKRRYEALELPQCYSRSITPKSFIMEDSLQCEQFMDVIQELIISYNETNFPLKWITKSSTRHKGYGIELLDFTKASYFYKLYREQTVSDVSCQRVLDNHKDLIVQEYISNPALIENRKFDFRVFMMIVNVEPLVVAWAPHNGHTRLSDFEFDKSSKEFTAHITANVAGKNPGSLEFLKSYRLNLQEIAEYYKNQLGDPQRWLEEVAFPQVKQILIHMVRSGQQNFLVQREGLIEFFGIDLILDDTLQNFYLLESNRRPDVQEKNSKLQYREDEIVYDFSKVAKYKLITPNLDTDQLFAQLKSFVPLIDETKPDPYLGEIPQECSVPFKDFNWELPVDPMIEPLVHYVFQDSNNKWK